jgi:hypothetical protein
MHVEQQPDTVLIRLQGEFDLTCEQPRRSDKREQLTTDYGTIHKWAGARDGRPASVRETMDTYPARDYVRACTSWSIWVIPA